jgi:DNA-binding transcriptional MerR regulator
LRIYDQLGLVTPAHVAPQSGYRLYREEQVETARLVALLRRIDMPLADIAAVLAQPPATRAAAVTAYWQRAETVFAERRAFASYLETVLTGVEMNTYELQLRDQPQRDVVGIQRHLQLDEMDAFFDDAFHRLRSVGAGLEGIAGCPYLVFYGEVSQDGDGPVELCRPVAATPRTDQAGSDLHAWVEPAHDEVYVRLALADVTWPAMLPAVDALYGWAQEHQRQPSGPVRQVLIADQRTATPQTLVCDLTLPLKESATGSTADAAI